MAFREIGYRALVHAARPLLHAAAPLNDKLGRGVAGWSGSLDRLRLWSKAHRSDQPLVWVHAPSVGESLMAQAIVSELRRARPNLQIAFTHFSASAERGRERVAADVSDYLPWDTTRTMSAALDLLRPAAIAFVRTEIWPGLTRMAVQRRIPLLLVNAVLATGSSRLGPLARFALRPAYQRLDFVGAINDETAARFSRLGVPPARIRVTGDARFDQVWARLRHLQPDQPLLHRLRGDGIKTVVAGSTWPADEAHLLPAVARVAANQRVRLILAPHEPDAKHLEQAARASAAAGLSHALLAKVEHNAGPLPTVIIVDRVGVLADLYALADIAFVGGAFQGSGVHSVVEPAAFGVPVLMGPGHQNAEEAGQLLQSGGAIEVAGTAALAHALRTWLGNESLRREAAVAARTLVTRRLGGAAANAALITEVMDRAVTN
ncbi:MAG TPA: glycosyltransferase N-terminal domain-containing protein [Longimicrobiales bacterium]|nr:glycosyltransferase N-terminal domain-containing protein [Longimicrobiales bacterium]